MRIAECFTYADGLVAISLSVNCHTGACDPVTISLSENV